MIIDLYPITLSALACGFLIGSAAGLIYQLLAFFFKVLRGYDKE